MTTNSSSTAYGAATENQMGLVNGTIARALARAGQSVAPAAGEVGELRVFTASASSNSTFASFQPVTGLETNLPKGTWVIISHGNFTLSAVSPAAGIAVGSHRFVIDGVSQPVTSRSQKLTGTPAIGDSTEGAYFLSETITVETGTKNVIVRHAAILLSGAATAGTIITRETSKLLCLCIG